MRNYIELNNQSSEEIEGFLIQGLPPISKPQIRTSIEEIDGRDGDIVTKLGYAALNKEMEVGLYGDFDIDEVIKFFDSEGRVVFSNEPEKYYNYQIIDQIDFDRLVRFRKAKVKMHVQPFKFSTIEVAKTFDAKPNLISIPDFTQTENGVTLTVDDGAVTFQGTATEATEFYVPITALNLAAGSYTLSLTSNNPGASVRLIGSAPSDQDSFGNNYAALEDGTVNLQDTLEEAKAFGYLWFYITAETDLDLSMTAELTNDNSAPVTVRNTGNIFARPLLTLRGTGTVNLSLNGQQVFIIYFPDEPTAITIDTAAMEAYIAGSPDVLMNRYVDGDYNNFKLALGTNTITWTGDLEQITIDKYSRWI